HDEHRPLDGELDGRESARRHNRSGDGRRSALRRDAVTSSIRNREAAGDRLPEERDARDESGRPAVRTAQFARVPVRLRPIMRRPKLPKSKIECPTCDKASGFAINGDGFSRRNFLRIAGQGIVATYFADELSPRLLQAATTSTGVTLRNTAKNCIF